MGRALRDRVRRRGDHPRGPAGGDRLMPQPPNLNKMLQQAQEMMAQQQEAQEALKQERVEASAGGGMVKVVASGDLRLQSITIDPDAVDPEDVEMLQDLVTAAVNEALRQVEELAPPRWAAAWATWTPTRCSRRSAGSAWAADSPAAAAGRRPPARGAQPRGAPRAEEEVDAARAAGPAPHHRARPAAGHRRAHRTAPGLPHPAQHGRGGQRPVGRDPRGQGPHPPVRDLLQPRGRAALHDLRRRPPRSDGHLRRRGGGGRHPGRAHP